MSDDSETSAKPESEREPEGLLDKARRAGALSSYVTIGVLLWLLVDARSENRGLREQFWKLKCPTPSAAVVVPKPSEPDTLTTLRLLEWVALRCPATSAPRMHQGVTSSGKDDKAACACQPVTKVTDLRGAKQTPNQGSD